MGCRFGDQCRFSHSAAAAVASCWFYASVGGCRYGAKCRYKHPDSSEQCKIVDVAESNKSKEPKPKPSNNDILTVFGFIRKMKQRKSQNEEVKIPEVIFNKIVDFYSIIVQWDSNKKWHHTNMSIVDNGNCIKMTNGNNWGSAFLTQEYFEGIHHWKFKIESLDSRRKYYVLFGIWKTKSGPDPILDRYFTDKKENGYAMNAIDGTLTIPKTPGCGGTKYATYCKTGDVIDMFCDFNSLLLSFAINGKYYENGQKIEKTTYKVAVSMYWEGDTIRLMSHSKIKRIPF